MKASKRAVLASGIAVTVALLAGAAWLLFAQPSQGPLHSPTDRSGPIIDSSTMHVEPGQSALATAFLVNPSSDPAALVSASPIPIPGMRAAKLTHIAVNTTHNMIASGKGWPPTVPVRPFARAKVGHGQTDITYGITGTATGVWATAGLRITYRWHGSTYSVTAWSANVACIHYRHCDNELDVAESQTEKLAGRAGT